MSRFVSALLLLTLLTACGGGDGSAPAATTKVVRISTTGTTAQQIYGIEFVAALPPGVTLEKKPNNDIADGVVTLYGAAIGSSIDAIYSTSGASALHITIASGAPFGTGDFLTVNCTVAAGTTLTAGDITLTEFTAYDGNGAAITGISGSVALIP